MKSTDEMMEEVRDVLNEMREISEKQKNGPWEEGAPQLTQGELFLLAYVDYLEHRIESRNRLDEINERGRKIVEQHKQRFEGMGWT